MSRAIGEHTFQWTIEEVCKGVLTKTKMLSDKTYDFQLLETIGLIDGKWILLDEHLTRMQRSADYFNYPLKLERLTNNLKNVQTKYNSGNWRVRVTVDSFGNETIDVQKLQNIEKTVVRLAEKPIDKNNRFLYYKTTYRTFYDQHRDPTGKYFDTLLWNKQQEVTEFTIGNVIYKLDGKLYTPPIECGLLPGTFRKRLLKEGKIKERKLCVEELPSCTQLWFINSVRGWIRVKLDFSTVQINKKTI